MSNVLHPPRGDDQDDRRRRPRLRELVDEMLAGIRVAANRELWTDDERVRAASELAGIMEQVRQEALITPDLA